MAQDNRKVIKSWTFAAFRADYGKVKRPVYKNQAGEEFSKLAFQKSDNTWCFVGWSSNMGEISNEELKARAGELRVVQLEVDEEEQKRRKKAGYQVETYKVCEPGDYTPKSDSWEDVDI